MKVTHLGYFGFTGGAGGAVAVRLLHFGLLKTGIDSNILCMAGENKFYNILEVKPSKIEKQMNQFLKKITFQLGLQGLLGAGTFRIKKHPLYTEADIINIHRIFDFISFLTLPLLKEKIIVFTLHDMWGFTGHCYAVTDCDRWKIGCGQCPYPKMFPAIKKDNTRLEWRLKRWTYEHSNLTIVTLSNWHTEQVKQSMLKHFPVHKIPTGIDTELYKPLDPDRCRAMLGIQRDKKVLLYISSSLNNHIKGPDLLLKTLRRLPRSLKSETVLVLIGKNGDHIAHETDIKTVYLGYIKNDHLKAIVYSAADLFIHPTRADILPVVVIESMSCGTPVAAFEVGGVPDLVHHGKTGYLSQREDAKDLCNGIISLLEDDPLRDTMKINCRELILNDYSLELQVQRYINLYSKLLNC